MSPTFWSAADSRSARRTASWPGWSATRWRQGKTLSELSREELAAQSPLLDDEFYPC